MYKQEEGNGRDLRAMSSESMNYMGEDASRCIYGSS
jgi:hypothetical protein